MSLIKLTQNDWEELLPSTAVVLGKTVVEIKPLSVFQLKGMGSKIAAVFKALAEQGVNSDSLDTQEGMAAIFSALIDYAPGLLQEATGIHADDIAKLPLIKGVELLRVVIEVNISSYQDLLKNLKALGAVVKEAPMIQAGE